MKRKSISYAKWGYIFLIPFFVVYIIFSLYPLIQTFYNSFHDYVIDRGTIDVWGAYTSGGTDSATKIEYCGLDNYVKVFSSGETLMTSFKNTVVIWLVGFIPQIAISLLLATWFTDLRLKIKAQGFFKAIIYLPNVIMASAIAFMFYSLFSKGGAFFDIACKLTGRDDTLFNSVWGTRGIIGFLNFLLWYGNTTILLMAAIMGVDTSLYESAQIDGANPSQTFWKITMPLIKPIMIYVLITSLIGGIQMYDIPALITNDTGQPNIGSDHTTMTLMMEIQNRKDSNVGLASAVCVVIFFMTAILGGISFFVTGEKSGKKKKKKKKGVR